MKFTTKFTSRCVIYALIICFCSIKVNAQQEEVAPTVIQMNPPVVVNFQQLADYELVHPVKKKKRFIEQGEDREKNGTFIPQPIPSGSPIFDFPNTGKGGGPNQVFSQAPVISFNGTLDNGTLIPPDIRGAAGTSFVMETTNQEFKIYTKAGALNSTLSIINFFSGSGGSGFFDPHIIYDNNNSRFVICIDGKLSNNHSALFIAVSQTSNPTGTWWLYSVDATGNTNDFMDYPLLGLNNNWVVVTGRNFKSAGPVTPTIFVWNRASVYAGTAATAFSFTDATNGITLAPAQTYDNAQSTEYLVCNWNGNSGGSGFIRLSSITGTASSPVYASGSTIGVASPWNDNGSLSVGAAQNGTTTKIESGDSRIGNAVFINGSLWFSHTAYLPATSPTRSAVDWWQVNPSGPVVQQFGRIDSGVTSGFNFYSSIAVNPAGDVLIGYCHSSLNMFASSAYSFHAASDAAGTSQSMYIYKNGLASYNKTFGSGRNRYGDYTGSALDPVDNSFWNFSEWTQTGNNWGTGIANIAASPSGALSAISTSAISPLSYCAGAPVNVSYTTTGTANAGNIFIAQLSNSSGSFSSPTDIGNLSSTTSGTVAATIPAGTATGSGYRIRVISSNPAITGSDNGTNISISAQVAAAGAISGPSAVCAGSTGISFSVGIIANTSTYTWSFPTGTTITSGAGTNSVLVNFSSGTLSGTVSVFGSNTSCTGSSSSISLTVNTVPSCSVSGITAVCPGNTTQLCAPAGNASYLWSTGATTQCISTGAAGTYTVTVTSTKGCTSSCNATVTVNTAPSCTISGNTTICSGSSTQLCGPAGNSAYLWSTGATTQCMTTGSAGTYTVTVTNANGCTASCSATVAVSSLPVCDITGNLTFCQGSSTQLCAPAGNSSYLWSTGATVQCITTITAGTYTVTVTNSSGCTSSCNATVTVNPAPACTISGNGVICQGSSTQFCAPAGGVSYLWSTGASTQCITTGTQGFYSVTVTNANGCSSSCSASLTVNALPNCAISGNTNFCAGSSTQLCAPPGNSSYLWSTGASTQCITTGAAGTYTVTVTDGAGCSSSCSVTVTINQLANCTITGAASLCQGSSTQLCAPAGNISYLWNTGATTQCITTGTAGTYSITATSGTGCLSTCSITVTVNSLPVCNISGNTAICQGNTSQLCSPPGNAGYLWSTGASSQCIAAGTQGTYTITVTDANGCSSSCNTTLTVNPLPGCSISGNTSVCQGSTTQLCASVGNSSYLWSNGISTQCIITGTAVTYTVTVTNGNGCTSSCSAALAVNQLPTVSFSGLASSYSVSNPPVTLTGSPSGGSFSGPGISGNTFTPANAGAGGPYTITYSYTDINGCSNLSSQQTTVINCTKPAKPGAITSIGGTSKICPGDSKSYSVPAVAGAASYTWIAPIGGVVTSGQGTVQVTITYNTGFTATDTLRVTANNACGSSAQRTLKISIGSKPGTPSVITGQTFGVCNGTGIPYSVTNVSGVNYNWSFSVGGASVASGQGSNAITANYTPSFSSGSLLVTAGNGCGVSAQRKLTIKAVPANPPSITGPTTVCAKQAGVPYSIMPIAGASDYTWTGPSGSRFSDGTVTSSGTSLTTTSTSVIVNYGNSAGNLKVRANNSCGSSGYFIDIITFNCRGAEDITVTDVDFNVSPNPNNGNFTIKFTSEKNQTVTLSLLNSIGQKFYNKEWILKKGQNSSDLNMSEELSPGVYYLVIKCDSGTWRQKVVKE